MLNISIQLVILSAAKNLQLYLKFVMQSKVIFNRIQNDEVCPETWFSVNSQQKFNPSTAQDNTSVGYIMFLTIRKNSL